VTGITTGLHKRHTMALQVTVRKVILSNTIGKKVIWNSFHFVSTFGR
jgi:hypothetical protein